jgi:hypothetical protein
MKISFRLHRAITLALFAHGAAAQSPADWIQLFNGRDLSGWSVKITGYELNDNFPNTFSVHDGAMPGVD